MIVGFITTYAISAYHHLRCEFESRSGEVYSIQHYVIKFVSDLRRSVVFSRYSSFLHQENWPPRYNWNIVESILKHHNPNCPTFKSLSTKDYNIWNNWNNMIWWLPVKWYNRCDESLLMLPKVVLYLYYCWGDPLIKRGVGWGEKKF